MLYAAGGLLLSLAVHVLTFSNYQPPENLFWALHVGIFPLWIPVVFIASKLTAGMKYRDPWGFRMWERMFSGCPTWLKYMTYGFLAYAFVNFAIFFVRGGTG